MQFHLAEELSREIPRELLGDQGGFRISLYIIAGLSILGGVLVPICAGWRIVQNLIRPLPAITDMRAKTPDMQMLYAVGFSIAAVLSGFTLLAQGPSTARNISAYFLAHDATAKIIKLENPNTTQPRARGLYRLEDARKLSQTKAEYIYYTDQNQPITTTGVLPSSVAWSHPHPGDTFTVTYNPRHPDQHHFGSRPSGIYMVPAILEFVLLLFMLSGGIIGVRQNLGWE
jgi:hypothetical protein